MIIVVAIDGLEYELVEKFECENLKQEFYGKTDISEFSEPRTIVLWSSFLTGRNMEQEILNKGKHVMWDITINARDSFLSHFNKYSVIDLPGFSYDKDQHASERNLLKQFFDANSEEKKEKIKERYNNLAFEHHRKIKEKFFEALKQNYELVISYFSIADVIGHLNFGNNFLMKMIYKELDEIVGKVRKNYKNPIFVLSDHGMKKAGIFGDHSEYGFWSTNFKELGIPKLTDFANIILEVKNENRD